MIAFVEEFIVYITIICAAWYFVHAVRSGLAARLEEDVIESLDGLAAELDKGNALETALVNLAKRAGPSSSEYLIVVELVRSGRSLKEALSLSASSSKSPSFRYVCSVLRVDQKSRDDLASSIKELSKKLWEISHLEHSVQEKAGRAIMTLQLVGIVFLPVLYFFLAGVVEMASGGPVEILRTPLFVGYLLLTSMACAVLDGVVFKDWQEAVFIVPLAASYFGLVMLKIGPYVMAAFGGFYA